METNNNQGVIITGGSSTIQNIAAGTGASINVNSNSANSNPIDFDSLNEELKKLRLILLELSDNSPESHISIAEVAKAEIASKEKDESNVVKHLKAAGKWALDTATKIGVSVVTDLIKSNI